MVDYVDLAKKLVKAGRYPVLVFLFSRRLVEEKAVATASALDLLEEDARAKVLERISELSGACKSLHASLFRCLKSGIGYHHAGLLPSAKRLVEDLFVDGLLPVVFCTETFAMGVNYPARAVAIGQVTKYAGDGEFRTLTNREMLQMAGRAGRRGQDRRGYAYICVDPEYPEDAPVRAPEIPEAVMPASGYTPEGVLRIIAGLGTDRELLKKYTTKSFAAYSAEVARKRLWAEYQALQQSLDAQLLEEGCSDFEACWTWRRQLRRLDGELRQLQNNIEQTGAALEKRKKGSSSSKKVRRLQKNLEKYRKEIAEAEKKRQELLDRLAGHPECDRWPDCSVFERVKKLAQKRDNLLRKHDAAPSAESVGWDAFVRETGCLVAAGFLEDTWNLTWKGQLALDAGPGGVLAAEILSRVLAGKKKSISPAELAGIVGACLCESEDECKYNSFSAFGEAARAILFLEQCGIDRFYSDAWEDAVSGWASGQSIARCAQTIEKGPGNFIMLARRTAEVLRSLVNGRAFPHDVRMKTREAHELIWRSEVADVLLG